MIEKNWLDLKKPDELEIKQSEYNPSGWTIRAWLWRDHR